VITSISAGGFDLPLAGKGMGVEYDSATSPAGGVAIVAINTAPSDGYLTRQSQGSDCVDFDGTTTTTTAAAAAEDEQATFSTSTATASLQFDRQVAIGCSPRKPALNTASISSESSSSCGVGKRGPTAARFDAPTSPAQAIIPVLASLPRHITGSTATTTGPIR